MHEKSLLFANSEQILATLAIEARACKSCEPQLPLGARPIFQVDESAKILIVGQAPGARAHASGIPWADASGARLRAWMGIDDRMFYDSSKIAIVPMSLCYPGRGRGGDLPPRRECEERWVTKLIISLTNVRLTLLVGAFAQRYMLRSKARSSLTHTVRDWQAYAPEHIPLPHPSPRNTPWLTAHPWFSTEVVPPLQKRVRAAFEEETS